MKPSEKEVLDTLRKTTLAYLSESDYARIEKAVEQQGILHLTGTASAIVKSAVQKHGGGSHDQGSHGSWANGGMGGTTSGANTPQTPEAWGREEDKLSAKFERTMDVTTSDAQGMAMAEMQRKYGTSQRELFAPSGKNNISAKKTNEFVGGSYHRVDTKTNAGALDKLLGKGEEIMGDKYERKVTEQWDAEFTDKSTGKSFRASVYDWMRYDDKGMTAEQGQKMPLLARDQSHSFHIGADSKEQAQIVQDYIETESKRRYLSAAE